MRTARRNRQYDEQRSIIKLAERTSKTSEGIILFIEDFDIEQEEQHP